MRSIAVLGFGVLLTGVSLAQAADAYPPSRAPVAYSAPQAVGSTVELGVEARFFRRWEGSSETRVLPSPIINIRPAGTARRFSAPDDGIGLGLIDTGNFRAGPVGKLRADRKASNDPRLAGLGDVDWAIELGAFAEWWVLPWLRTRGEIRHGVTGHHGLVGDLTADAVWLATPQLTLSIGPRIAFGSASALRPYFGVDPGQSALSGLPVYNPGGGIRSYGAGAQARYEWTKQWATRFYVEYDRLAGSVADAPLIRLRGERDQWSFGAGVSYTFDVPWSLPWQ